MQVMSNFDDQSFISKSTVPSTLKGASKFEKSKFSESVRSRKQSFKAFMMNLLDKNQDGTQPTISQEINLKAIREFNDIQITLGHDTNKSIDMKATIDQKYLKKQTEIDNN